jgi:hypothetical protein
MFDFLRRLFCGASVNATGAPDSSRRTDPEYVNAAEDGADVATSGTSTWHACPEYLNHRKKILMLNDSPMHTSKMGRVGAILMECWLEAGLMSFNVHETGMLTLILGDGPGENRQLPSHLNGELSDLLKEAEAVYLKETSCFEQLTSRIVNFPAMSSDDLDCSLPNPDTVQFVFGTFVGSVLASVKIDDLEEGSLFHDLFVRMGALAGLFGDD